VAVTNSTLPEQTHNNIAERNCQKYNAKQSHHIIINNSKFFEYKMLSTLPIKIIPLPYACIGRRPTLHAASRAPCRVPLADRERLTGTSKPNARGTLLPP
jgi:hypothetical protein